jgi:molybdopterin molybdotransferase
MLGFAWLHRPERTGALRAPWRKFGADPRLTLLRVVARPSAGGLAVELTGPQGSGLLSSMMRANALALIPGEILALPEGAEVRLHLLDEPEDH